MLEGFLIGSWVILGAVLIISGASKSNSILVLCGLILLFLAICLAEELPMVIMGGMILGFVILGMLIQIWGLKYPRKENEDD